MVGVTGEIITSIGENGVGEVAFVAQGGRMTYSARSVDGQPIRRGTLVTVTDIVGSVALVQPRGGE